MYAVFGRTDSPNSSQVVGLVTGSYQDEQMLNLSAERRRR